MDSPLPVGLAFSERSYCVRQITDTDATDYRHYGRLFDADDAVIVSHDGVDQTLCHRRMRMAAESWIFGIAISRSEQANPKRGDRILIFQPSRADIITNAQMTTQQNLGLKTAANTGDAAEHVKRHWLQKWRFEEGECSHPLFPGNNRARLESECNVFAGAPLQVPRSATAINEIACHRRNGLARRPFGLKAPGTGRKLLPSNPSGRFQQGPQALFARERNNARGHANQQIERPPSRGRRETARKKGV